MEKKQFNKFCKLLEGNEGCNFIEKIKDDPNSITWKCYHDFRFTKKILKNYFKEVDIQKFIEFCKNNGGYCDCEILYNVAEESRLKAKYWKKVGPPHSDEGAGPPAK